MYGLEDEAIIVLDSVHLSSLEPIPTDNWEGLKPGLVDIVPEFISREVMLKHGEALGITQVVVYGE